MANKFKAGMLNFIEVLNQMWDAFAAGPYNAVPLTGGTVSGRLASTLGMFAANDNGTGSQSVSSGLHNVYLNSDPVSGERRLAAQYGVRGISSTSFNGAWLCMTSSGPGYFSSDYTLSFVARDVQAGMNSVTPLKLTGNGNVDVGTRLAAPLLQSEKLHVGYAGTAPQNVFAKYGDPQGTVLLTLSYCCEFFLADGPPTNPAATVFTLSMNSITGRSISTRGTINANGADYAEYLIKGPLCGTIAPGQIVGIDAQGKLTDKWDLAISFAVKSTNPCMVGGDSWAAHLGERPVVPVPPTAPERQDNQTDEQWAEVLAGAQVAQQDYAVALAAALVAQREFDNALEQARQTVDRIAFAGQVPVNLQGAAPGQFIVPVRDGDGIAGLAVDEADITLRQYMRAIGRVIAIEDDGRARIIVKVA